MPSNHAIPDPPWPFEICKNGPIWFNFPYRCHYCGSGPVDLEETATGIDRLDGGPLHIEDCEYFFLKALKDAK